MPKRISAPDFQALLAKIGDGVPDAAQYQLMSDLTVDIPEARQLAGLNPFSPEYRRAALELYLSLRGNQDAGYDPTRDEPPAQDLPSDLWSGLVPWSFRDTALVSEHLFAWSRVFRHLDVPERSSILEYGPGSGQMLLMLARMGFRACGVDIDTTSLQAIDAQAAHLGLPVETEQGQFGEGFGSEQFDAIIFYEAFHHALDFDALLIKLRSRLKPGGKLLLCGEPIVSVPVSAVPYPWGPRLDALSVFCIQRFGWMELGFTHDFFAAVVRATGWTARRVRADRGRALLYVLEPVAPAPADLQTANRIAAMDWKQSSWKRTIATTLRRSAVRSRNALGTVAARR